MKEYGINFVIWWYWFKFKDMFYLSRFWFYFIMTYTRTLPMIKSFGKPLYGDKSKGGILIGIFIRFWWIVFGGMICIVFMIPFVFALTVVALLPVIAVVQLIRIT